MSKLSKRMKEAKKNVAGDKTHTLDEAIGLIERFPKVKFDESVELHLRLETDPKSSDQAVRGTVILPHGSGKSIKIAVICKGEAETKAKEAGADFVGEKELIEKISGGFLGFDVVVATPDMMREMSKLGKVLGPRGLMPTPKAGTVTNDVTKAINEIKSGKIEFKSDKQSGIHVGFGKRSFDKQQLIENAKYLLAAINAAKPNTVKVNLIKSASVSTTMGPGVKVSV